MADMTCAKMKRKFEEVEQAAHSSMETLTGYEKCLLQNKLLLARSRLVKYENLCVIYEAQVSMAKLDVEIATSDIDLLLQELQRGKRFKTDEAIRTLSTHTQTASQPPPSPTKSISDTSRISFELPRVDLTSFTRQSSDKGQEPITSQGNTQLSAKSHGETVQELTTSQGEHISQEENTQELTISQGENIQELTTSQGSKDSGYNSSQKSLLISQETTPGFNLLPKNLVTQEIQVEPSDDTKDSNTEIVKNNNKCKHKKIVKSTTKCKPKNVSDIKDKTETSKNMTNKKLKSTEDVLSSDKIKSKVKQTNEKPKANDKASNIDEKTQKTDNTRRKSVQRCQSHDNRHRKRDEKQSGSYERRYSTESRKKNTDRFDLLKDVPNHREKTNDRKSTKEKYEVKFDEKQSRNRNNDGIKPKNRPTPDAKHIEPRHINNRKSRNNDKGDKIHRDYRHEEEKKSDQEQLKPERSQNKSESAQKSNLHRKENTDPRIKPIRAKNESNKTKYKSKQSEDISCDTTLVIAEESMEIETTLPNQIIEDFTSYDIPHNSPIHYTDFANTILSSVAISNAPYTTRNTVGVTNSQNTIAQSTPFVRRIANLKHSGSECQDLPSNVASSDHLIEDQLTTFIRTTLADYNRDVAELNLLPDTHTITDKNTKTKDKNTTTKLNDENTCKNTADDKITKINEENARKTDSKPKTPEKMIKRTKQNLMVKIPVTRLPDTINHTKPTVVQTEPRNQMPTVKQPCLTVTVNDAGVIIIRPKSAESSNLPSPKLKRTLEKTHKQNTQDIFARSTTLHNLNEPVKAAKPTAQEVLPSTPKTLAKLNTQHAEMPNETASYMTQVKDQYYFDVDSPRLADEAPTHKNALSLFRAFSLLMPPSPTFTVSSSSDKENCTSNTPSPPQVQKMPINKKIIEDFVPSTFHSYRNYTANVAKNDIHNSHTNDMNTNYRNDMGTNYRNDMNTNYRNNINTNYRNAINTNYRNDIYTNYRNDINTNYRNAINTNYRNDIHPTHSNKIMNNISNNTKPMPIRRSKSISETIPRRTIKFTDAQPLPIRKTKSTTAPRPKTNRRKSLDDRAILRVLHEPCSSHSSKSASPRSTAPTPKKKDLNPSSDRLLYGLYKDIHTARCRNFTMKRSKHICIYCGLVTEGHLCFFTLKKVLEQC